MRFGSSERLGLGSRERALGQGKWADRSTLPQILVIPRQFRNRGELGHTLEARATQEKGRLMSSTARSVLTILALACLLCLATMPSQQPETLVAAEAPANHSDSGGRCWAQAGRVVGGFWGALAATAISPWAAGSAWIAYSGLLNNEPKDNDGNFLC